MKNKIILFEPEEVQFCIRTVENFLELAKEHIAWLVQLENETEIKLIEPTSGIDAFLTATKVVTNSDRISQYGFNDITEDFPNFCSFVKTEMYKTKYGGLDNPKTGSPKIAQFDPVLPENLIRRILTNQRQIDALVASSKSYPYWKSQLRIEDHQIKVEENYKDNIKAYYSKYLEESQIPVYEGIKSIIQQIEELEYKTKLRSGFVLDSLKFDNKYELTKSKLLEI